MTYRLGLGLTYTVRAAEAATWPEEGSPRSCSPARPIHRQSPTTAQLCRCRHLDVEDTEKDISSQVWRCCLLTSAAGRSAEFRNQPAVEVGTIQTSSTVNSQPTYWRADHRTILQRYIRLKTGITHTAHHTPHTTHHTGWSGRTTRSRHRWGAYRAPKTPYLDWRGLTSKEVR